MKISFISVFIQISGILSFLVGVVSIIGYITHITYLYRWSPDFTRGMAVNTSLTFIIQGMAIFLLGKITGKMTFLLKK